jgi:hypothetical protein
MRKNFGIAMTAGVLLGGTCATAAPPPAADTYPADYKAQVSAYLERSLKDPYSAVVKEVRGPRATIRRLGGGLLFGGTKTPVHTVCYQVNAKNSYGAFVGLKTAMFTFRGGRIIGEDWSPALLYGQAQEVEIAEVLNDCAQPADPPPVDGAVRSDGSTPPPGTGS